MKYYLASLAVLAVVPFLVNSQDVINAISPTAYHLKIDVSDLASAPTFNGSVQIHLALSGSAAKSINLQIDNITVHNESVLLFQKSRISPWSQVEIGRVESFPNMVVIHPRQSLYSRTMEYRLDINFQGYYRDYMEGFAKLSYVFEDKIKYMAVSNFDSSFARAIFPCFDSLMYRTNFEVEITVDSQLTALSNVWPSHTNDTDPTKKTFTFKSYPSMTVTQLSLVVVDMSTYVFRSDNSSGSIVRTHAPYAYGNHTGWANRVTSLLLAAANNYTKSEYFLPRFEQIVIPDFYIGSTPGWGFISYSEEPVLITPRRSSTLETQRAALELARGVVHQWFGASVTIDTWDNLWISQGFVEYLKFIVSASVPDMSSWELMDQVLVDLVQPAMALDSGTTIENPLGNTLTRFRGGALLRMVHHLVGDDAFNNGVAEYLIMYNNSRTYPMDCWEMIQQIAQDAAVDFAGETLDSIMTQWANFPGYPVLNVTSNGTHFIISQPQESQVYVPVTYQLHNSKSVVKAWLPLSDSLSIPAGSSRWILVNVNQVGYYRVNYDSALWEQLSSNIAQLPHLSRSQLIDDAFSLADSGTLSLDSLLQFTSYLSSETHYIPWVTALTHFQNLMDKLYGHSSYDSLQTHVRELLTKVIADVGLMSKPQDSHTDKLKRVLVLQKACAFGHPLCLQKAVSMYKSWTNSQFYDEDLSTGLLCAAMSNTSAKEWHSLWNMFHYASVPTVRASILKALSCTKDTSILKSFLNNATSTSKPTLTLKNKMIFLETMASTPQGAQLLLDWLLERLNGKMVSSTVMTSEIGEQAQTDSSVVNSLVPGESLPETTTVTAHVISARDVTTPEQLQESDITAILLYITPKLTTAEQVDKIEAFLSQNISSVSNSTQDQMKRTVRTIHQQHQWARGVNENIKSWLEKTTTTSDKPTSPSSDSPATPPANEKAGASAMYTSSSLFISVAVCVFFLRTGVHL